MSAQYTLKEVAQRDGRDGASTWIVLHDMIYDVTNYKNKHPGGTELIEEYAGQDATSAFDDFGHSSDAKRILKDLLVGEIVDEDRRGNRKKKGENEGAKTKKIKDGRRRVFLSTIFGNCVS